MVSLEAFIEQQLGLWEVPGCAVAAILGDEVVLNRGFGTRELGKDAPVSTRTLFPIGSTTKSFTGAGVGALVDDGLLGWDQPLRDLIPGFVMHDPVATDRLTVVDLLSHRSGIPRHEFVWLGHPERTRADIVARLRHLEQSADIRQAFQYSNLGYMTVGHLVEVVTGHAWEDFTAARLLKPLGMDRTNFSIEDVQRSDDFSKPHERRDGAVVEIPFRPFDQAGPAGSINSCADDMTEWLRANLGLSAPGGGEVVSDATRAQVHRPHVTIPEDRTFPESTRSGYGLGWVVGRYRGHRIVEHNGGVDGFLADCMLLPDDGIGVVVLTNCWSAVGPAIAYRVFDELLNLEPIDWAERLKERFDALSAEQGKARTERPRVDGASLLRPPDEYAGTYEHPGYGRFDIAVEGTRLIPRFGTLDLSLTHRHFDVFDLECHELVNQEISFSLTFLTAPDGSVSALEVPFEEQVAPIKFERRPDPSG
jgi:CubicO group peptidase (beta-lactamase class C family)